MTTEKPEPASETPEADLAKRDFGDALRLARAELCLGPLRRARDVLARLPEEPAKTRD